MTRYIATINVPGYLPMDDDPPTFETARDAWQYLVDESQHDGESAWLVDDIDDPDGPASLAPWALELERMVETDRIGTVYSPTPGLDERTDDMSTDLGLAWSVDYREEEDDQS